MSYDEKGFLPLRFNEAKRLIEQTQERELDVPLSYTTNKLADQINTVYARAYDLLAQGVESAFSSLKLGEARGAELDEIGKFRRVFRLRATRSFTTEYTAVMEANRTIPAGTLFGSDLIVERAYNPDSVLADPLSAREVVLKTTKAVDNTTYTIVINGTVFLYSTQSGATIEEIHNSLISQANAPADKEYTVLEEVVGSSRKLKVVADEGKLVSVVSRVIHIIPETVTVVFRLLAVNTGRVSIPSGVLNKVITPVPGIKEVVNPVDFTLGRDLESDVDFRRRIEVGDVAGGTGTYAAIREALLNNVPNTTSVDVFENVDNDSPNAVIPLYHYNVVIESGSSDEVIAAEVYRTKPEGVPLFGTTTVPHVNSGGQTKFVSFSRPTATRIFVQVDINAIPGRDLPDNHEDVIRQVVRDYADSLPIGGVFMVGEIYGRIYASVVDINVRSITARTISSGSLGTGALLMGNSNFASVSDEDIEIV